MDPSLKSNAIEKMLNETSLKAFGRERTDTIKHNICVTCGRQATQFKDALSIKEYSISGMCQDCQDKTFGLDDIDEPDWREYA
jgi:hypothetical protein